MSKANRLSSNNTALQPSYLQQFRDFFFKHFEDDYMYAYAVKQSFKFDKELTLIECQPCKFDSSHFGANWYPAVPLQNAFYGIYDKKLFVIKDFNITQINDAPHVSGYGYSYIHDQFILAFDPGVQSWFVYDVTGKSSDHKWNKVSSVWNRNKMLLHHFDGAIYIIDMQSSDFLIVKSYNPQTLQFQTEEIKQTIPTTHKWVGTIYESLFTFVCENDGQKDSNILIDISVLPPKFIKSKTYLQQLHNTFICRDTIYSKFGARPLKAELEPFQFNFNNWKAQQQEIQLLNKTAMQQKQQIDELTETITNHKQLIAKLFQILQETNKDTNIKQIAKEYEQEIHGDNIGTVDETNK